MQQDQYRLPDTRMFAKEDHLRVAVVSDTHGLLRQEVLERLSGCDAILHAGDVDSPKLLEALEKVAPTYAVRGNNDLYWDQELPEDLTVHMGGLRIYMVHDISDVPEEMEPPDIVIYGHSHIFGMEQNEETLYLNPGSCGKRRFRLELTMAILTIDHAKATVERIRLQ